MTQMPLVGGPAADLGDLVRRVDRAGRVRRRDEEQGLGALRAVRVKLLDRRQVAGALIGHDGYRHAAGQRDRLRVGGPVRRRQQHLVARVEQSGECLEDGLLAAVGDQHLTGGDRQAGVPCRLRGDGFPQLGQPGRRGVLVEPRLCAGAGRRLDDVVRGREIRLTDAEADHWPAGCPQGLGLRVHSQRRRLGDGSYPGRDSVRCGTHVLHGGTSARVAAAGRSQSPVSAPGHRGRRRGRAGVASGGGVKVGYRRSRTVRRRGRWQRTLQHLVAVRQVARACPHGPSQGSSSIG